MSKHDTHFFNNFSMVIGGLIVVALLIFALARVVAGRTQEPQLYSDPKYVAAVDRAHQALRPAWRWPAPTIPH